MGVKQKISGFFQSNFGRTIVMVFVLLNIMGFAESQRGKAEYSQAVIQVEDGPSKNLISTSDISHALEMVTSNTDGKISSFSTKEIEDKTLENPFVYESTAFKQLNGELSVNLVAQEPILRVVNNSNAWYYINKYGQKFRLSEKYSARALVATGNIDEEVYPTDTLKTFQLQELYKTALYIGKDQLLKGLIGQINIDKNNDISLITRNTESQTIILGNTENIEQKFSNLKTFYKKVLSLKGWDKYTSISLKFSNQIVAK